MCQENIPICILTNSLIRARIVMKEFNLKEAKSGKPICTRDGRPARIICFDKKDEYYPIVALISDFEEHEECLSYNLDGRFVHNGHTCYDLMMDSEKHERWVNLYRNSKGGNTVDNTPYFSKESAVELGKPIPGYITTVKIEWEE